MGRTQRKAGNQMLSHLVPQGDQVVLGEALTKEADSTHLLVHWKGEDMVEMYDVLAVLRLSRRRCPDRVR